MADRIIDGGCVCTHTHTHTTHAPTSDLSALTAQSEYILQIDMKCTFYIVLAEAYTKVYQHL